MPAYANFVAGVHRALPVMIALLKSLLAERAPLRFADSTMIPVCRQVRSKSHKVAKGLAAWGKNHQDWFYGFKLHISIDHLNRICAAVAPNSCQQSWLDRDFRQLVEKYFVVAACLTAPIMQSP